MSFVVRGPVAPTSPVYIEREHALDTVSSWLDKADCVGAILGARQTGKTTLCHGLRAHLGQRYAFVYVDFQGFDGATWNECAGYIADMVAELCTGDEVPTRPRRGAELARFLREVATGVAARRIVIIFEEIGNLPERCREKLAQITRSLFNARLQYPALRRYVYLVVGAHEVRDLAGTKTSPLWNVAEKLYLGDFSASEVETLVCGALAAADSVSRDSAQRLAGFVYEWTGGHPYWTQRLARELATRHLPGDPDFVDRQGAQAVVHALVRTEDSNLPFLFQLLERERAYLLPALEDIQDDDLEFSRFDRRVATLELIGVIANRDGRCVIRNRIYERALIQRPLPQPVAQVERATVMSVDMVGYSTLATYLQQVIGDDAVALLDESIQAQIRAGLDGCGLDDSCVYRFTGDGAILCFTDARQAHEFAVAFFAVVHARNREIPDRSRWREFRAGAATGEITWSRGHAGTEGKSLVFTVATRLESAGSHGHLLLDAITWSALPGEIASRYQDAEDVELRGVGQRRVHRLVTRDEYP